MSQKMPILKKAILILLILSIKFSCYSFELTPSTKFSILTNTPGKELYTLFGHSAIRLTDSSQNIDVVFNYGTFDFSTPYFYLKFIKGNLDYFLSVETFRQYLWSTDPCQTIYEQILKLNESEKQELTNFLLTNIQPENRFYNYKFFDDNCATRIRDALKISLDDKINFLLYKPEDEQSFRKLLKPYIAVNPWIDIGINLLLGIDADRIAKPLDYCYLPEYVKDMIDVTTIKFGNEHIPITNETRILHQGETTGKKAGNLFLPFTLFCIILLMVCALTCFEYKKKRAYFIFDQFIFGIIGLLGLFLFIISIYTDHLPMKYNLNIIWAFPLHFIVIFILNKPKLKYLLQYYFTGSIILLIIFSIIWIFFQPQFYLGLIPLILSIGIRSIRLYYYYKTTRFK